MKRISLFLFLILSFSIFNHNRCSADPQDPFDPFDILTGDDIDNKDDQDKSVSQLINEARTLLASPDESRPLDARSKLLLALKKDPEAYKAHSLLAGYYLSQVGHFKLSMKYLKRALEIFKEKYGSPPFADFDLQNDHANLIYLLSQTRLNLDDYQGALAALDEYTSYGYFGDWYPGTRAWILMKLGNIQEAIKVARVGVLGGAEPGRTLNMLGILLSMDGQEEESLKVLKEAIDFEFSLGKLGQPATPLNNSGEVFKELFMEDKAESYWLKALSLPDGCDHVLASLNLTLLYIDQTKFQEAKRTLDNFESCIAQFPLRNNEEHQVLVRLARARIALLTGDPSSAIPNLEKALEGQQWFGKIGTNQNDLEVGATISLAQSYQAHSNILDSTVSNSILENLNNRYQSIKDKIKSRWYFRKARQELSEGLNNFEDIHIRNTDSLIEYPTLDDVLTGIPTNLLKSRIEAEEKRDQREKALLYYRYYIANNQLKRSYFGTPGLADLKDLFNSLTDPNDALLKAKIAVDIMSAIDTKSIEYDSLASFLLTTEKSFIRNYGIKINTNYNLGFSDQKLISIFNKTNFNLDNSEDHSLMLDIQKNDAGFKATLTDKKSNSPIFTLSSKDRYDLVNRFNNGVFSYEQFK